MWQSTFTGEWEIGAFDSSLKSRGMSVRYNVLMCGREDLLVDREIDEDNISDYIDNPGFGPRGSRPQNHTVLLRVCKKVPVNNSTHSANTSSLNATDDRRCYLKKVTFTPPGGEDANVTSGEIIPDNILDELQLDAEVTAVPNGTLRVGERALRRRRQGEYNRTDVNIHSGEGGRDERMDTREEPAENRTNIDEKSGTKNLEEGIENFLTSNPAMNKMAFTDEPVTSGEKIQNYIISEAEKLKPHQQQSVNIAGNELSIEYDDYTQEVLFLMCVCL